MTQLKEMMFEMKKQWENKEFDNFYNNICFGQRGYDEFDLINIEACIAQAVLSGAYNDPHIKGVGNIMLGFMYGDILANNLTSGSWVFGANPTSWSDFYISFRTKKGQMATLKPFSRVLRFIQDCEKNSEEAIKGNNNLRGLLEEAKAL